MMKQVSIVLFVLFSCYIGVHSQKTKFLTHKIEVHAPANEAWGLYRNLGILKLAAQQLKNIIQRIDFSGDGGVNTIVNYTFVPGNSRYDEIFTEIDDVHMVKVAGGIKGDCLAIGCRFQYAQFNIIESTRSSCFIKSDIGYGVRKGFEAHDPKPDIQFLAAIARVAKEFLEHPA